ncbi:MAG: carbohydrate-binding family 9-like protein [Candidatus Aminicenantes bacterium]|nr:carbohydrate-binding family 9-like protein [Candidatus Aminicenantes bacterium]
MKIKYGCDEQEIGHYTCHRISEKITVDGNLIEKAWQKTPKSPRFVDMVTGEPGFWDTRMASVWDDRCLYIAFWIEEPDVKAEFTERDSQIYMENDVEVFIEGEDCYYEFQINARGTIYEVFYIWQEAYNKHRRFHLPEFDLMQRNVDIIGGFQDETRYGRHPRGKRWAFMDWDFPGLKSAVQVEGTLNNSSDVDKGWTVELAFPWEGMKFLAGNRSFPPKNGDVWRFDFSRFELLDCNGIQFDHHPGWSFNKHCIYDSHIPECFTYVHFSDEIIV